MVKISKKDIEKHKKTLQEKYIKYVLNSKLHMNGFYTVIELLREITYYLNEKGITFEEAYKNKRKYDKGSSSFSAGYPHFYKWGRNAPSIFILDKLHLI